MNTKTILLTIEFSLNSSEVKKAEHFFPNKRELEQYLLVLKEVRYEFSDTYDSFKNILFLMNKLSTQIRTIKYVKYSLRTFNLEGFFNYLLNRCLSDFEKRDINLYFENISFLDFCITYRGLKCMKYIMNL